MNFALSPLMRTQRNPAEIRRKGILAEERVAAFLEKEGCAVLARNVAFRTGEIDVVAFHRALRRLRFVEVRCASPTFQYFPMTPSKVRKIGRAVACYLQEMGNYDGLEIRIELAVVTDQTIEWFSLID
jgi:Holliday junction resolvase-like predicted endonuclease